MQLLLQFPGENGHTNHYYNAVDMSHGDRLETIVCSKVTKDLSITILNGLNQTKIVGGKICF